MEPLSLTFIISAFVAGVVTFLAPCTLPLVPGYLSFISGASVADLQNPEKAGKAKAKIFLNGLFY
ncbi:MAG TPA: cytochrome c biogenesis protein CcdA, partial [Candidatus Paceibacterota bacterium]